ncbi:MAG: hypothetical protein KBH03_08010 [Paludibacteraceae bacterium]|jgi:hypothetical protein|nr:hypothetical protein [Paludibacteraceae bacterium]
MSNDVKEESVADLSNDETANGVSEQVKLISVDPFSKYNYSMLTFNVNGKEEKHGLSDLMLREIIKDKEKLAVRTDSVSQSRQTVPASVVSVP